LATSDLLPDEARYLEPGTLRNLVIGFEAATAKALTDLRTAVARALDWRTYGVVCDESGHELIDPAEAMLRRGYAGRVSVPEGAGKARCPSCGAKLDWRP